MKLRVFSWAIYDFANTIFSMNVVSRYFPVMAIGLLGGTDLAIGVSRSSAMVLVALTMPLLGTFADERNNRKLPLILFTLACCGLTAALGISRVLIVELVLFSLAIYCYQSALTFYNALLPAVSPAGKIGYVSGLGVSLGYAGSITGLAVVAVLSNKLFSPYIWTSLLFLFFSLPIFFWVKDVRRVPPQESASLERYTRGLIASLKRARRIPGLIRFLVSRFFIVDAMETVILFMSVYLIRAAGYSGTARVGLGLDEVTFYLIVATFFTVLGSYLWGILTNRHGPLTMMSWAVALWLVAFAGFIFTSHKTLIYLWGSVAGIGLGGIWTADRPLLINLVGAPEKLGEFFGLYALSGRLAAVLGPIIWGTIVYFFEPWGVIRYKLAIAALFLMMSIGLLILRKVPDAR